MPLGDKRPFTNYPAEKSKKKQQHHDDVDGTDSEEEHDEHYRYEADAGGLPNAVYDLPETVDTSLYANTGASNLADARGLGGDDNRSRRGWRESFVNLLSPTTTGGGGTHQNRSRSATSQLGGANATSATGPFYQDDMYTRMHAINSTDVVQHYAPRQKGANTSNTANTAATAKPVDPQEAMAAFVKDGGFVVKGAHKAGRYLGNAVAVTLYPVRGAGNAADPNGSASRSSAAYDFGSSLVGAGAQALGTVNTARNAVLVEGGSRLAEAITSTGIPLAGPMSRFAMRRVNGVLTKTIGAKAAFVMGAASAAFPPPPSPQTMH